MCLRYIRLSPLNDQGAGQEVRGGKNRAHYRYKSSCLNLAHFHVLKGFHINESNLFWMNHVQARSWGKTWVSNLCFRCVMFSRPSFSLSKHRLNLELWIVWGWSDCLMRLAHLLGVVILVFSLSLSPPFFLSLLNLDIDLNGVNCHKRWANMSSEPKIVPQRAWKMNWWHQVWRD